MGLIGCPHLGKRGRPSGVSVGRGGPVDRRDNIERTILVDPPAQLCAPWLGVHSPHLLSIVQTK
jgi:hypothetical protein